MVPFVVMVTGLPAAGKSTLCEALAPRLGLPILKSDTVKEALFDSIGYSTRDWSSFLSTVAVDVSFRLLPEVGPCLLDVFMPRHVAESRLRESAEEIIEVHCAIDYASAWRRFIGRAERGERHRGHVDDEVTFDFYTESLRPQMVDRPFNFGKHTLRVDTTGDSDLEAIYAWVTARIADVTAR